MKINRLWISQYKNLENVTFTFKSNLVSLLVGNNGLGKSNLIEILLQLFLEIERIEKEDEMRDWATEHFQFELDYQNKTDNVFIKLREENVIDEDRKELVLQYFIKPLMADGEYPFVEIEFKEFQKIKTRFIPEYIVGYYSGENKRIYNIVQKYQAAEKTRLLKQSNKGGKSVFDETFRRVFIAENIHSPLILLTISLFSHYGKEFDHFKTLLSDYLQIEDIVEFSIRFNNPDWNYEKLGNPVVNRDMEHLIANIQDETENPFWNLSGKLDRLLTRFYNYDVDRGRDSVFYESDDPYKKPFEKEILAFSEINVSKFALELKDIFVEPINFFDALETTTFIDILKDITFKIKKRGVSELIEYRALSEGEQQLLTTIGLLILFNDRESLFLYDEPDTHLNPSWQRDYVHLLETFNQGKENNQMLAATHSPLIVQSSRNADVFLFKKNKEKIEVDSDDHQIHNWRIDQVLVSEYFGLTSARPRSLDDYMDLRERILSNPQPSEDDIAELESLSNEFGVLPTGETTTDLRAMRLIRLLTGEKDD